MKVIEPYTAICLQTTPPICLNNKELTRGHRVRHRDVQLVHPDRGRAVLWGQRRRTSLCSRKTHCHTGIRNFHFSSGQEKKPPTTF